VLSCKTGEFLLYRPAARVGARRRVDATARIGLGCILRCSDWLIDLMEEST
jgi:hypothetical protein